MNRNRESSRSEIPAQWLPSRRRSFPLQWVAHVFVERARSRDPFPNFFFSLHDSPRLRACIIDASRARRHFECAALVVVGYSASCERKKLRPIKSKRRVFHAVLMRCKVGREALPSRPHARESLTTMSFHKVALPVFNKTPNQ